jgi:hypothetical protein
LCFKTAEGGLNPSRGPSAALAALTNRRAKGRGEQGDDDERSAGLPAAAFNAKDGTLNIPLRFRWISTAFVVGARTAIARRHPSRPRVARIEGHRRHVCLSRHVDLRLVSRLEFASGAVAMRYEPKR